VEENNKIPTVFLSYSWKNKDQATIIENDFNKIGISLQKDTIDLKYKDSISDYMKSIRNADFAIILLSDDYLKSENCMFEALEILKEQNHKEKILPILVKGTKVFNAKDRIGYIKYWKTRKEELQNDLKEIDITSSLNSYSDLKNYETIYSSIDNFLKTLGDFKTSTLEELKEENYKSVIEYLGFEDISFVLDLIILSQINNYNIQEIAIDKHLQTFGESYLALSTKALIKDKLRKKDEAKFLYEKSLKINPNNAYTLNNLGFLLDSQFNNPKKAIDFYKKAININPKLIIARINLALTYNKEGKIEKAKKEYLKTLKISPSDVDAHNNLGNIYRTLKKKEKAIYHFEKAIEYNSKYPNAYLNLGNYYDVQLNEFEKAIPYYEKAKKIANNETMDYIIEMMYKFRKKRE
jgi:tetratricopeptide (TPR) repeat protein